MMTMTAAVRFCLFVCVSFLAWDVQAQQCKIPGYVDYENNFAGAMKLTYERQQQEERRQQQHAERARALEERRKKQKLEQQQREAEAKRLRDEKLKQQREEEMKRRSEQARKRQRREQNKQPPVRPEGKECPYKILGVTMEATQAEIKKAYRSLSLKYHPDKNPGDDESQELFTKLVDAYEILGDEENRAMHDNDTFGAYQSRPHNFNSKAGFYSKAGLVVPLNQTEFDRLVLCRGPFESDEMCVPWMVKFYAPWCVHCKNLMTDWKRAASTLDGTETPLGFVRFGAVNCESDKPICTKAGVSAYPTVVLYARDSNGQEHTEKFPDRKQRNVDNLIEHAEKGIRLVHESTLEQIDAFVMEKQVTNPDETGLWIVMFESGGACPQCSTLKASLRRMSANIGGLANFGILNCGKEPTVCKDQYVGNQYPVLKMYPYKGVKGAGETLVQSGQDPLAVLPVVEKVIRMCIENIEAENGLMKTLHEDEKYEEPEVPRQQYAYPQPEQKARYVLPAGVRAASAGQFIASD
jgi:thiol-disulfide isomerase/thioredoxin